MEVIFSALVIVMFLAGVGFGFVLGKNGFVQIGRTVEKEGSERKKTVEEQLIDLMSYDGARSRE